LLLVQQVMQSYGVTIGVYDSALIQLVEKHAHLSNKRFKD
jgi:hypothetical protein